MSYVHISYRMLSLWGWAGHKTWSHSVRKIEITPLALDVPFTDIGNSSPQMVHGNGSMANMEKNTYEMNAMIGNMPYGGSSTCLYVLVYAMMAISDTAMPLLDTTVSVFRRTWCSAENVKLPTTRAMDRNMVTVMPSHCTRQSRNTSTE